MEAITIDSLLEQRGIAMEDPLVEILNAKMGGEREPCVSARRRLNYTYVEVFAGQITLEYIMILQDYMEQWLTGPGIKGLVFFGCGFTGPAMKYFAEHFPYINIKLIQIILCLSEEVAEVSVVNRNEHDYSHDSVADFLLYETINHVPERALSSIATRFVEHNTALQKLTVQKVGPSMWPFGMNTPWAAPTECMLKAMLDRCNGWSSDQLGPTDVTLDIMEKRSAELLRDILGHKNGTIESLILGHGSVHQDYLACILSGIATNTGMLKKLYLDNLPWEVSDWEIFLRSLQCNQKKDFQLRILCTGKLIGTPSEKLITDINEAFQSQCHIKRIVTPGMEQLRFFQLKSWIDNQIRYYICEHHRFEDVPRREITNEFLEEDSRRRNILWRPKHLWRTAFQPDADEADPVVEAECVSGIYHALRSGCGMHDWQSLADRMSVPIRAGSPERQTVSAAVPMADSTRIHVGGDAASERPIKKRKQI